MWQTFTSVGHLDVILTDGTDCFHSHAALRTRYRAAKTCQRVIRGFIGRRRVSVCRPTASVRCFILRVLPFDLLAGAATQV